MNLWWNWQKYEQFLKLTDRAFFVKIEKLLIKNNHFYTKLWTTLRSPRKARLNQGTRYSQGMVSSFQGIFYRKRHFSTKQKANVSSFKRFITSTGTWTRPEMQFKKLKAAFTKTQAYFWQKNQRYGGNFEYQETSKTTFNNDQQGKKVLGKTGLNKLKSLNLLKLFNQLK